MKIFFLNCVIALVLFLNSNKILLAQSPLKFGIQLSELDIRSQEPSPRPGDLYTGIAFDYAKLTSGIKFGLSLDKSFKNYGIQMNPSFLTKDFKYNHSQFEIKNITSGITRNTVLYWGINLPVLLYRNLRVNENSDFKLMLGPNFSYDWIEGEKQVYQFTSDSFLDITSSTALGGESGKLVTGISYGVHYNYTFTKYGSVEFGLTMNQPFVDMPESNYSIIVNDIGYKSTIPVKLSYLSYDIAYYFGRKK